MWDSQTKNAGKIMADMMRGAMNPGVDQPFEAPRVKERIKRTIATNILHICFRKYSFSKLFVEYLTHMKHPGRSILANLSFTSEFSPLLLGIQNIDHTPTGNTIADMILKNHLQASPCPPEGINIMIPAIIFPVEFARAPLIA